MILIINFWPFPTTTLVVGTPSEHQPLDIPVNSKAKFFSILTMITLSVAMLDLGIADLIHKILIG
ncbi:hypothetical protein ACQ86O_21080 [Serratia sp. L9]|uniref:hypothetical protein n=1 Tax=Serratia sp. L9 TaxID=3423946 RepID=UPI003D6651A4